MLVISLILTSALILLSIISAARAKKPPRTYWLCWLGVLPAAIPCIYFFPAYSYHAFALGIFATVSSIAHFPRWIFLLGSLSMAPPIYLTIMLPVWRQVQETARLYPQQSIEEALAYEGQKYEASGRPRPKPADEEQRRATQFMGISGSPSRYYALQALHDGTTDLFINAAGFGVGRMGRYGPESIREADPIRLAEPKTLPQPPLDGYESPITAEDTLMPSGAPVAMGPFQSLHDNSLGDFLNVLGFGYVRDRQRVTGFLAHRFTKYPEFEVGHPLWTWRLDALDLISLLKHPEPVAYVSKHLPRMDELREAPTRALDEFERERLPKLQSGEQLSAAQGSRRIRMLGAIRAQDVCLNCHTANKDDLLGAFSYDLRLDLPASTKR